MPRSGIRLQAEGADAFIRALARSESAIDSFRKAASRPTPFAGPDTRSASQAFARMQADAQKAGQGAGSGFSNAFSTGIGPLDTIVQGAFLRLGSLATDAFIGAFKQIGASFQDSLDFGQLVADITAVTGDVSAAARDLISDSVQAAATNPALFVNIQQAGEAARSLLKTGQDTADVTGGLLEQVVLLQNAAGSAEGALSDYQTAASLTGRGLQLFGLDASQAGEFVNGVTAVLTGSAIKSLGDYQYALLNSGQAIQQLQLGTQEYNAAIIATSASFSSGRTLGTAFESLLSKLANTTDDSKLALQQLGISAFDSTGKFVGLVELQRQLTGAQESGKFTQEALLNLYARAFGEVGSGFATAIAGADDLNGVMEEVGNTSAAAIAAIRTDTASAALGNLGDIAEALRLKLTLPFTETLQPAIVAVSNLLQALAGQFEAVGLAVANFLGPLVSGFTAQINALTASLGGVGLASSAAPVQGTASGPGINERESTFADGPANAAVRAQEQIGIAQLNAAATAGKSAQAIESALSSIEGLFSASKVTEEDVKAAAAGQYQDKADEFVRRLNAAAESGGKEFAETIPQAREALTRIGIVPSEDLHTLAIQIQQAWADASLFSAKENIALIDEEAIKAAVAAKEKAAQGRANLVAAFGGLVDSLIEGTNAGLAGGGAVTPAKTPDAKTQIIDPYDMYVKPVQDAQVAQAKQAGEKQAGIFGGLFTQFDTLEERLGGLGLIFAGFSGILAGITSSVEGQDFTAAGAAVGGTLTTVLDSLIKISEQTDLGTTTANLSNFVQALNTAAGDLSDGIDGEAVAGSASTLITTVIGKLGEAIDKADLVGIATSVTGYLAKVAGLFVEAVNGVDFVGIGTSAGELLGKVAAQITNALGDPTVSANLGTAAQAFASSTIMALQGAFSTLGGALAIADEDTEAGDITKSISRLIISITSGFTGAIDGAKLDQIVAGATRMVANVANLLVEAINGIDFTGIGTSVGELFGKLVNQITGALGDPSVGENLGTAAGEFVTGLITAVQGAFSLLSGALTGVDDTLDISALTSSLDTLVKSFVDGFIGAITRNFTNPETGAIEIPIPTITLPSFTAENWTVGQVPVPGKVNPTFNESTWTIGSIPIPSIDSDSTPLAKSLDLVALAFRGAALAVGAVDTSLQKATAEGGGLDLLSALVTGTIDSITGSIKDVDVSAIGGAINTAILSVTGLFVTLSEIPDLGAVTGSVGGLVTALLNLATGTVLNLDGEAIGGDIAKFAANLVTRLADGIKAVPLAEIAVAAANLIGAIAGTFRDAFTTENLSGVGQSIGDLVGSIIGQLTSVLSNPDFADALGTAFSDLIIGLTTGLTGLLQGFTQSFEGDDTGGLSNLAVAFGSFIQNFIDAAGVQLKEADYGALGQALLDGIYGAIVALITGSTPAELTAATNAQIEQQNAEIEAARSAGEDPITNPFAKFGQFLGENLGGLFGSAESMAAITGVTPTGEVQPVLVTNPESLVSSAGTSGEPLVVLTPEATAALQDHTAAINNQTAVTTAANLIAPVMGDREVLTEYGPDTTKLVEEQTKAIADNTTAKQTEVSDPSSALINPQIMQQLTLLGTSIPVAGAHFVTVLGTTAISASGASEKLIGLGEKSEELVDTYLDPFGKSISGTTGSLNILLDKSKKASESVSNLNDALTTGGLAGGLTDLTEALDNAVTDINTVIGNLGSDTTTPTPDPNNPQPFARGGLTTGMRSLVGEDGPELAYNAARHAAYLVGAQGPEIRDFLHGTQIYTAEETNRILARSGGSSERIYSAAAGLFNTSSSIPSGGTIPIGDEGIQTEDREPNRALQTSLFDDPFVQAFFRARGEDVPTQGIAQSIMSNRTAQGALSGSMDDLVELFNRPLFGGKYSPASTVVNVTVNNSTDNSVRTNNYNMGGVTTKQSVGRIIDDFALLKAIYA